MEISLRADLRNAYNLFNQQDPDSKMKAVWYKLILETKSKLLLFIPTSESEDSQTINIAYKVVEADE